MNILKELHKMHCVGIKEIEQNKVFSLIKENFEIDSIDISIIIEK